MTRRKLQGGHDREIVILRQGQGDSDWEKIKEDSNREAGTWKQWQKTVTGRK